MRVEWSKLVRIYVDIPRAVLANASMVINRAFKSGNSQAVRIPADLAYGDIAQDLRITRLGDVITIAPAKRSLTQVVAELRAHAC